MEHSKSAIGSAALTHCPGNKCLALLLGTLLFLISQGSVAQPAYDPEMYGGHGRYDTSSIEYRGWIVRPPFPPPPWRKYGGLGNPVWWPVRRPPPPPPPFKGPFPLVVPHYIYDPYDRYEEYIPYIQHYYKNYWN